MYRVNKWRNENPNKIRLQRKRNKVRSRLRVIGILPSNLSEMTKEEKEIYDQIGNNDYSFWDIIKSKDSHDGGKQPPNKNKGLKNNSVEHRLWSRAKENSKKYKKDFNIDVSDIIIPEYCPILNIKLETDIKYNKSDNYYTIDRLDSQLGYIKGNIKVISKLANTMKSNATKEQLSVFSKNINNYMNT